MLNILLSGSGSGGHIYPCLALYNYLKDKYNVKILIFKEIDKRIYEMNNVKYIYIDDNYSVLKKLSLINKAIKNNNINKVITFGGKNSFYINIISKKLHIDSFIFESNAISGKANKMSYLLVNKIFTNFKLNLKKEINVGNPNAFVLTNKKIKLFNNKKITILITLGSLGSSSVSKVIEKLLINNDDFNFIYVIGNNVKLKKTIKKNNVKIYQYYNNLKELINSVDIVIARAGAATLSEIVAYNKPSIIIPSPYVTNNHQLKNAKYLLNRHCIILIEEKDLTLTKLNNQLTKLALNKDLYENIKSNLIKNSFNNNFKIIEDEIIK